VDVRHEQTTRAELRFAAAAGVRDRVEAIVAAESQCCAFLVMNVSDEPGTVVLVIQAPEGAELVLQELVDAFRGSAVYPRGAVTKNPCPGSPKGTRNRRRDHT
jgi:hypothetical protein